MKFDYTPDWLDHEADKDAARERLIDHADFLRDEQRDRAWEAALERDAGPWDERDAFSLAKEHEFFEEQRDAAEKTFTSPVDALTSKYGTESHRHDQDVSQGSPAAPKNQS